MHYCKGNCYKEACKSVWNSRFLFSEKACPKQRVHAYIALALPVVGDSFGRANTFWCNTVRPDSQMLMDAHMLLSWLTCSWIWTCSSKDLASTSERIWVHTQRTWIWMCSSFTALNDQTNGHMGHFLTGSADNLTELFFTCTIWTVFTILVHWHILGNCKPTNSKLPL